MNTFPTRISKGLATASVAAALLAASSLPTTAARFAVHIMDHDGSTLIPGEAPDPRAGWIEVSAFGNALEQKRTDDGDVAAATCSHGGFTIRKHLDKASPLLQDAMTTGLLLPAVQAVSLAPDGSTASNTTVTLRHVQVTDYRILGNFTGSSAAGGDPLPTEEITLNYSEVEWTYIHRNSAGSPGETTSAQLVVIARTDDPALDDDDDGLSNDLDADDDNDGISDRDEVRGGSNPFLDDADDDLDGDGVSNRKEAIAATRMDDPSDFFGIEKITHRRTPEGLQATVSFPVAEGRRYRLLASPDPSIPKELWMVLDEFEIPVGSPETGADIELDSEFLKNVPSLYFRAEVSRAEQ